MAGRVVNIRSGEPYDVYVGRANGRYRLKASPWANPFVIGPDGDRATVIRKYEDWLRNQPDLMRALPDLRGKTLACHADVLVRLANAPAAVEAVV